MFVAKLWNSSQHIIKRVTGGYPVDKTSNHDSSRSVESGYRELKGFRTYFDARYYLENNPEVKALRVDPLLHYINYGWKEYRNPSKLFDVYCYLSRNSDVRNSGTEPLYHFLTNGKKEKRSPCYKEKTNDNYKDFIKKYDKITLEDELCIKNAIELFAIKPTISLIINLNKPVRKCIAKLIALINSQLYQNWELILICENDSQIVEFKKMGNLKVKMLLSSEVLKSGISAIFNICKSEFLAIIGQNDLLPKHSLYMVVNEINKCRGNVDIIYADEDTIKINGVRRNPYFKPDWDPILFKRKNYLGNSCIYNVTTLQNLKSRFTFEDFIGNDFVKIVIKETVTPQVLHIPFILFHKSNATNTRGLNASIDEGDFQVKQVNENFLSIIVFGDDNYNLLEKCLNGLLLNQINNNFNVFVVNQFELPENNLEKLQNIIKFTPLTYTQGLPIPEILNEIVSKYIKTATVLFIDNRVELTNKHILNDMVYEINQNNVAVVGISLTLPNGAVSTDTILNTLLNNFNDKGVYQYPASFNRFGKIEDYTRTTATVSNECMLVKVSMFRGVQGFNSQDFHEKFYDTDFCLRLAKNQEKSYNVDFSIKLAEHDRVVCVASKAALIRPLLVMDKSKLNRQKEDCKNLIIRHSFTQDKFYNPNLSLQEIYFLSGFPRVAKPWNDWTEVVCPFHRGDVILIVQVCFYAWKIGKKIRLHVSKNLIDWVLEFLPPFPVEILPCGIPKPKEIQKFLNMAFAYVESRSDFSGKIAHVHQESFFSHNIVSLVEIMLYKLELPVNAILDNVLPKIDVIPETIKNILSKNRSVLIHPYGGWELKTMPVHVIAKIVNDLHNSGYFVIQIGGASDARISNVDDFILENYLPAKWAIILKKAVGLVCVDSWLSHFAAIVDIPHAVYYGPTPAYNINAQRYFKNQTCKNMIVYPSVDCSPCGLEKWCTRYSQGYCKGLEHNLNIAEYFEQFMPLEDHGLVNYIDADYYLMFRPLVERSKRDILLDYLKFGWKHNISISPYFDIEYYLAENSDVRNNEVEPFSHYLNFGWKEWRNPNRYFSTKSYLEENKDKLGLGEEPLLHYTVGLKNSVTQISKVSGVMAKGRRVAVVIPVYKDWLTLKTCIVSLKSSIKNDSFRVIMINDRSEEYLELKELVLNEIAGDKRFYYYENESNLGFVKTCNKALEYLYDDEDILLLNSDTKVTEGALDELVAVSNLHERIGVICPRSNNASLLSVPYFLARGIDRGDDADKCYDTYNKLKSYFARLDQIPTGVGFCMLIKRELVSKFGLFDEIYGKGYNEENDFCLRIQQHGYSIVMANFAFVYHYETKSFSNDQKQQLNKINEKILLSRYPNYFKMINQYLSSQEITLNYFSKNYFREDFLILFDCQNITANFNDIVEQLYYMNLIKFLINNNFTTIKFRILITDKRLITKYEMKKYKDIFITKDELMRDNTKFNLAIFSFECLSSTNFNFISLYSEKLVAVCNNRTMLRKNLNSDYLSLLDMMVKFVDGFIFMSDSSKDDFTNYFTLDKNILSTTNYPFTSSKLASGNNKKKISHIEYEKYFLVLCRSSLTELTVLDCLSDNMAYNFVFIGPEQINKQENSQFFSLDEIDDKFIQNAYLNCQALILPDDYQDFNFSLIHFLNITVKRIILPECSLNRELKQMVDNTNFIYLYDSYSRLSDLMALSWLENIVKPCDFSTMIKQKIELQNIKTEDFITEILKKQPNLYNLEQRKLFKKNMK